MLKFFLSSQFEIFQKTVFQFFKGAFRQAKDDAGFLCLIPCVESKAGSVSTRMQQLIVSCETKTKDNVFVRVSVAVLFFTKLKNRTTTFS